MKRKYILICILVIIMLVITLIIQKNHESETNTRNIIETEEENVFLNLSSGLQEKVLLAGLFYEFNYDDEVLLNETEVLDILEPLKFKKGIFVTENSREIVKKILYDMTGKQYNIDNEGYLEEIEEIESDIERDLNEFIKNPQKAKIINVGETYSTILGSEIIAGMIEPTVYVQNFDFSDEITISIINSNNIEPKEDLTRKDIAEEIFLNILNQY